jgi:hypothetical protein
MSKEYENDGLEGDRNETPAWMRAPITARAAAREARALSRGSVKAS